MTLWEKIKNAKLYSISVLALATAVIMSILAGWYGGIIAPLFAFVYCLYKVLSQERKQSEQ